MFGIKIPNIVIIVGVDDEPTQVFKKKRKDYIKKLVELRLSVH